MGRIEEIVPEQSLPHKFFYWYCYVDDILFYFTGKNKRLEEWK